MSQRHKWMAIVPYEMTAEDALRMTGGLPSPAGPIEVRAGDDPPASDDARPFLGAHNVRQDLTAVVCFACEQPITPENAHSACPGEPAGKLTYVDESGADTRLGERAAQGSNIAPNVRLGGVGRNDPCPCGSGEKFKRCHGA